MMSRLASAPLLALVAVMVLGLAAPVAATPVLFLVTQPTTSGPPYPSVPAVQMALSTATSPFFGTLALDLQSVSLNTPEMIRASNSRGGSETGGTMAFADVSIPGNPIIPSDPFRLTFRFDTMTGTVLMNGPPIRASDGRSFDMDADLLFHPSDPFIPGNPIRLRIRGSTLQAIQFTAVDPPGDSFFDLFVTTEILGPLDPTQPLFTMTLTGETLAVPEPGTLVLLGSCLAGLAGHGWRRQRKAAA